MMMMVGCDDDDGEYDDDDNDGGGGGDGIDDDGQLVYAVRIGKRGITFDRIPASATNVSCIRIEENIALYFLDVRNYIPTKYTFPTVNNSPTDILQSVNPGKSQRKTIITAK